MPAIILASSRPDHWRVFSDALQAEMQAEIVNVRSGAEALEVAQRSHPQPTTCANPWYGAGRTPHDENHTAGNCIKNSATIKPEMTIPLLLLKAGISLTTLNKRALPIQHSTATIASRRMIKP